MVLINLLPWRAQAQQYAQRQRRLVLAGAIILSVSIIVLLHILLQCWLSQLTQRVDEFNSAINQLQQRRQMVAAVGDASYAQALNQLTIYQKETRELIKQLNAPPISGVCFNKITRHQGGIRFDGYADSMLALSTFMPDWSAASHFQEIRINSLKLDHSGQLTFAFEGMEEHRLALSPVKRDHYSRA